MANVTNEPWLTLIGWPGTSKNTPKTTLLHLFLLVSSLADWSVSDNPLLIKDLDSYSALAVCYDCQ